MKLRILTYILFLTTIPAIAKITVATSLTDFASIANSIGGDRVDAFAIAKPTSNPHSVEVLPSYMVKVARARVYVKVGLGLDGWADQIISGSRNTNISVMDASQGIEVLEKPTGKVDASMGDVHPEGNPHYWLDPANAVMIAQNIYRALLAVDPDGSSYYQQRLSIFRNDAKVKSATLKKQMAPLANKAIFTYHSSWPYFAKAFGLRIVGKLEPVPGIPPTARHLSELLSIAKNEHVFALLQEPYFPKEGGAFMQRNANLHVLVSAPSANGSEAGEYWKHLEQIVQQITSMKE